MTIARVPLKLSKGILFLGDLHVESSALKECLSIAKEIAEQSDKADILIQLGDLCDKNKLNSEELYNLTQITNIWKKAFNEVHIVQGNHDRLDSNYSIIDYLSLLDIRIHPDDVYFYFKNTLIRCGHYFVDKSESAFGHFRYTLDDFKLGYSYGLLGHQHDFQALTNNFCHLGSARFVTFGENKTQYKRYAILSNSGLEFIPIKSTINMVDVSDLSTLEMIPHNTKIRYFFNSFEQLKQEVDIINNKKTLYHQFQTKINFKNSDIKTITQRIEKKNIFNEFLNQIQDQEVRNILAKEFKNEFNHAN